MFELLLRGVGNTRGDAHLLRLFVELDVVDQQLPEITKQRRRCGFDDTELALQLFQLRFQLGLHLLRSVSAAAGSGDVEIKASFDRQTEAQPLYAIVLDAGLHHRQRCGNLDSRRQVFGFGLLDDTGQHDVRGMFDPRELFARNDGLAAVDRRQHVRQSAEDERVRVGRPSARCRLQRLDRCLEIGLAVLLLLLRAGS